MVTKKNRKNVINTDRLDEDLALLEEMLKEEMYERSEKRLYDYIVNFWNTFEPSVFKNNWHIECIAEHVQAALDRKLRRICICIPPRSSKSIISSICFPTWALIRNPHEKFWLMSHTSKLFVQNIVYARRILEHPTYKDRWCDAKNTDHYKFSLSTDVNTKTRIDTNQGGYILGGSPTSGALGMGYSIAVLDDILDSEKANNPTEIENINNWYKQTFMNRSNDVKTDVVIIVMQRLNSKDLCDYVNRTYGEQGWFNLVLPAKYDPARTFISPIGWNDKRTIKNQLLDKERLTDEFLALQAKDPIIYNTRYQQDPDADSDGNLLKAEYIQECINKPQKYTALITVWDLSFSDSPEGSYTVGLVVGKVEDEYYVIDMFRKQCAIPEQLDAIRHMKKKYPKAVIGIERRANGHAAMSLLQREIKDIYAIEPRVFGGDKEQRFNSIVPYFRDRKIFIYNPLKHDISLEDTFSADAIKRELKSFPIGSTDDIVDCLSYAVQWLAEYAATTYGLITKGEKIRLGEEDYINANARIINRSVNALESLFNIENLPNRDDLINIRW
jgi:predicted phage terminase large subunit-like protein